jgi:putative DNA primase/helicase
MATGTPGKRRFLIGSEVELGRVLIDDLKQMGSGTTVISDRGKLYIYDLGGIWIPCAEDALGRRLQVYDGSEIWDGNANHRSSILTVTGHKIRGTLECARQWVYDHEFFDGAPPGIVFTNGFLMIEANGSVSLRAHSQAYRARARLDVAYDPQATAPRFMQFLEEVFAGDEDKDLKQQLLQEFTGACLLGLAPRYQRALVLVGERAANGKSTLLAIIQGLFAKPQLSAVTPQAMRHEYVRASLDGVLLNTVPELPTNDVLEASAFKSVITGDRVYARMPYGRPFTFCPQAGHVFATNTLPGTADYTEGFWRRFVVVPFNNHFAPAQQVVGLAARILQRELTGIAAWAIAGMARLHQRGYYEIPPSSEAARQSWQLAADDVRQFVEQATTLMGPPPVETLATRAYAAYVGWCRLNGLRPISSNLFGRRLRLCGFPSRHTKHGEAYPFKLC